MWIKEIELHAHSDVLISIANNKYDFEEQQKVSFDE
jgi:hypothetical protein